MNNLAKPRAHWEAQLAKMIADQEGIAQRAAKEHGMEYNEETREYFNAQVLGLINSFRAWINQNYP